MEDSTLTTSLQHLFTQRFRSMVTNLFQKLALATASTTLGLTVFSPTATTAATITYDFKFDLPNQPPITGSFSYDDSLVEDYPLIRYPFGSYPPEFPDCPFYCISGGSFVRPTDFQINISGTKFTKNNSTTFDLIFEKDVPRFFGSGFLLGYATGFRGTATWNNPYLSLVFDSITFFGYGGSFSTDVTKPADIDYFSPQFYVSESSFTQRNTDNTVVPEGQQELALLGLGILGIASLLKKKIASSKTS